MWWRRRGRSWKGNIQKQCTGACFYFYFSLNFASYQLLASIVTPDSTVTLMLLKAFIGFLAVVERQKWSSEGRGVPAEGFTDCLPPDACLLLLMEIWPSGLPALELLTGPCFYCLLYVVWFWSCFKSEDFTIAEEEPWYTEAIVTEFMFNSSCISRITGLAQEVQDPLSCRQTQMHHSFLEAEKCRAPLLRDHISAASAMLSGLAAQT